MGLFACSHPSVQPHAVFESQLTGPVSHLRTEHSAIPLANGQVFVSAGVENGYSHELYDPKTGTWFTADSSHSSYEAHALAQLPNGTVLVAGGWQSSDQNGLTRKRIGAVAEIYDPATNTWTLTDSLQIGRSLLSISTLKDGSLLAVGGFYLDTSGSRDRSLFSSVVERYDPITSQWEFAPGMRQARAGHEALILGDGRLMVVGGNVNAFTCEIFNPHTEVWTTTAQSPWAFRRNFRAAILDSDHVVVSGGIHEGVEGNQLCATYSISQDTWELIAPMKEPRADHTLLSVSNGVLLAIGGFSRLNNHPFYPTVDPIPSCERYDAATNTWEIIGNLNAKRARHRSVGLQDGRILTIGGSGNLMQEAEVQTLPQ